MRAFYACATAMFDVAQLGESHDPSVVLGVMKGCYGNADGNNDCDPPRG